MLGIKGGTSICNNGDKIRLNSRDETVDVKNGAEVELAKNRIEMMQVSYGEYMFSD